MKGIKLGEMNTMKVVKEVDFGMYLDGGDEGEILLPTRYVPEGCKPGDTLDVFVYLDQDERPVATTLTPRRWWVSLLTSKWLGQTSSEHFSTGD